MDYKRFHQLTVAEYQQLYTISRSDDDDIEKSIQLVSVLTGKPRWDVENISVQEFRTISAEIAVILSAQSTSTIPKRIIKLKGKKYLVEHNPRKISAGQYITLQHFLKGNMIDNLHSLFACLLTPYKLFGKGKHNGADHELISIAIQDLNFCHVHATCVFFLTLYEKSMTAIRDYLEIQARKGKKPEMPKELMDLWKLTDGYIMQ